MYIAGMMATERIVEAMRPKMMGKQRGSHMTSLSASRIRPVMVVMLVLKIGHGDTATDFHSGVCIIPLRIQMPIALGLSPCFLKGNSDGLSNQRKFVGSK